MKIISWNCSGKFREKFSLLKDLDADILVIQECENPQRYPKSDYESFSENFIWIGENQNKGLGIFARKEISISNNNWDSFCLRNFISVRVNNEFDVLAVWACSPYIEEYFIYQAINFHKYTKEMVIIGDFNSNAIWDKKHSPRDHSAVVNQLNDIGLVSAYHTVNKEFQGKETKNTFFLYRHSDKGYHIDYAFVQENNLMNFEILDSTKWLNYSDHIPIVLKIK